MGFLALIIGAGQAGLAAAYELTARGLVPGKDFVVLDAGDGPGGAWRERWDSLTLGKAHGIQDLPGLPMPRPDPSIPASILVAQYYGDYEEYLNLDVIRPVEVDRVEPASGEPDSPIRVVAGEQSWEARIVLNATGTWSHPFIPYIPGIENFRGRQLHTKDYGRAEDFAGEKTLVVGGGLSAVQFLLELADVTETVWATRRPPNFTARDFSTTWGLEVERAVRERTFHGLAPASVVRTTGIPARPEYIQGVEDGVLVSRGFFEKMLPDAVIFGDSSHATRDPLGPSARAHEVASASWDPYPMGHVEQVDVVFWNTGFRPALGHLSPMHLRGPEGIPMADEVTPAADRRVLLVGYGSAASTVGATRAGRKAGIAALKYLAEL